MIVISVGTANSFGLRDFHSALEHGTIEIKVMFDFDGNFVRQEYNNQFDWEMMDELIMTLDSSSKRPETIDATQASIPVSNVPSAEDIASKILVGHIRGRHDT